MLTPGVRLVRYGDQVTASSGPDGDAIAGGDDGEASGSKDLAAGGRADPPERASARPTTPATRNRRPAGRRIRGLEPEERRRERRRQLLESAFNLFATQGYARTSIEQICQGAYVGFKGFYDEFATKEALFLALFDEQVEQVSAAVIAAAARSDASAGPPVRELLEAFVHAVLDDPRVGQILFVEAAGLSPAVEAARRATYRSFAEFLFAVWAESGPVRGMLPAEGLDDHRIPLGLVGAIVELMVDWLVDSDGDTSRLIDDLVVYCRVMLTGLAATWPSRERTGFSL
jgi:AcrR family transcriptional regulator